MIRLHDDVGGDAITRMTVRPSSARAAQGVHQLLFQDRSSPGGGLVQVDQPGSADQLGCNADACALPPDRLRIFVADLVVFHGDEIEHGCDQTFASTAWRLLAAANGRIIRCLDRLVMRGHIGRAHIQMERKWSGLPVEIIADR